MTTKLIPALLALFLLLAGCGGDDGDAAVPERSDTEHNAADVRFATEMIQHHAQALAMVDLTLGRDLSPELTALAEQIREAQGPEIETMVDWLADWGEPIPETMRDHANSHGDGYGGNHEMPGMMTAEEMDDLRQAEGAGFEPLFLQMMIEHHEGAITMAEQEIAEGRYQPAVDLAGQIIEDQEAEIAEMEQLLGGA